MGLCPRSHALGGGASTQRRQGLRGGEVLTHYRAALERWGCNPTSLRCERWGFNPASLEPAAVIQGSLAAHGGGGSTHPRRPCGVTSYTRRSRAVWFDLLRSGVGGGDCFTSPACAVGHFFHVARFLVVDPLNLGIEARSGGRGASVGERLVALQTVNPAVLIQLPAATTQVVSWRPSPSQD